MWELCRRVLLKRARSTLREGELGGGPETRLDANQTRGTKTGVFR